MSTNGVARDFSNPGTKFVEVNEMLERKERTTMPTGISASWNTPIDEIDPSLLPADKREMILKTKQKELEKPTELATFSSSPQSIQSFHKLPAQSSQGHVLIPAQAIKMFKRVLDKFPSVNVRITLEQAESLLGELQLIKTPKNLSDAKAIIKLSDELEKIVEVNDVN